MPFLALLAAVSATLGLAAAYQGVEVVLLLGLLHQ